MWVYYLISFTQSISFFWFIIKYPFVMNNTEWGRMFHGYLHFKFPPNGDDDKLLTLTANAFTFGMFQKFEIFVFIWAYLRLSNLFALFAFIYFIYLLANKIFVFIWMFGDSDLLNWLLFSAIESGIRRRN